MVRNPVMFTVEIGTAVMLAVCIYQIVTGDTSQGALWYNITIFVILFITVLFANFAEALPKQEEKHRQKVCVKQEKTHRQKKFISLEKCLSMK